MSEQKRRKGKCNRDDVISLAMQHFETMEYDDIQMNVLAKELELSNGAIYYHFPTKQTLFFEIYNKYYMASLEDNLKALQVYSEMTPLQLKDYLLEMTKNMFEKHFNMVRLIKIHSMVLDKGVDLEKVKPCLEKSMEVMQAFIGELHMKNTYLSEQEILKILNARSSMIIGYFYMFMEPKIVDAPLSQEQKLAKKVVFKHKLMETLALYLDGVFARFL